MTADSEFPRTLCKPTFVVHDVTAVGGKVRVRFRGPRHAELLALLFLPGAALDLAADLEDAAGLAADHVRADETAGDWASCPPYDVPGLFADGLVPS